MLQHFTEVYFNSFLEGLNFTASISSFIGCVYILWNLIIAKKYSLYIKMMLLLTLGILAFIVSSLFSPWIKYEEPSFCNFLGSLGLYGAYCIVFWSVSLGHMSYRLSRDKSETDMRVYNWAFFFIGILMTFLTGFMGTYAHWIGADYILESGVCYIGLNNERLSMIASGIFYFVPFCALYFGVFYIFFKQQKVIRKMDESSKKLYGRCVQQLQYYPLALAISFFGLLVDDVLVVIFDEVTFIGGILHFVMANTLGVTNALIFWKLKSEKDLHMVTEFPDLESLTENQTDQNNSLVNK